jgi:hypothetical protein
MTSRYILVTIAVAAILASVAPPAGADPKAPAADTKKKPPAKAPAAAAKPKATPAPKDTPKPSKPEASDAAKPKAGPSSAHEVVEHESRIEFDERMVRGQSAAGAIFLFQRTPSELKSIVEVPDSFRAKTVEMLQPRRGTP